MPINIIRMSTIATQHIYQYILYTNYIYNHIYNPIFHFHTLFLISNILDLSWNTGCDPVVPMILLYYCSHFLASDFKFSMFSNYNIFFVVLAICVDDYPYIYFYSSFAFFNSFNASAYYSLYIKFVAKACSIGSVDFSGSANCFAIEWAHIKLEYCFYNTPCFL